MDNFRIPFQGVYEYVGDKKRCLQEGETVLEAGHILACGVKSHTRDEVMIVAFCAQSSHLREKPHELTVWIKKTGFKLQCSCKAGQSEKCKHCIALLLYLIKNPPASLGLLSCTDTAQARGKVKGPSWYEPTAIKDPCHVGATKDPQPPLTAEEHSLFHSILVEAAPDSALARHAKRQRRELPVPSAAASEHYDFVSSVVHRTCGPLYPVPRDAAGDDFYMNVVAMTYEDSETLCRETVQQNSSAWKVARRVRITASECYALYTAKGDFEGKFARLRGSNFHGTAATKFGTEHEPRARALYAEVTGATVHQCGLVVPPLSPWLGCSPDGIVVQQGSRKLLEIKCPVLCKDLSVLSQVRAKRLKYVELAEAENLTLKKRHKYYAQVQLSMTLLDLDTCDFCVYEKVSDSVIVIKVRRDDDFCKGLVEKLGRVYFSHCLPYLKAAR